MSKARKPFPRVAVGGTYLLDAERMPVRDTAASTNDASLSNQATDAEAAPGAAAESKAAAGGVPLASAEVSGKAKR